MHQQMPMKKPLYGMRPTIILPHPCDLSDIRNMRLSQRNMQQKCHLNAENSYRAPAVNLVFISDRDQSRYLLLVVRENVVIEDCWCARMR